MFFWISVAVVLWMLFGKRITASLQPLLNKTDVDEKLAELLNGDKGELVKNIAGVVDAFEVLRASTSCESCNAKIDELEKEVMAKVTQK